MTSVLRPFTARVWRLRPLVQDLRPRVIPYVFRIPQTVIHSSTCATCLYRCGVYSVLPAARVGRPVSPLTGMVHNKSFASTYGRAVSERRMLQNESFCARPEVFVPSTARFSSTRSATTPAVAPLVAAGGSFTAAPEAVNCSVVDYLVSMVKKQVRSDSGNVTAHTELESLLMRDDRHWDCLDTVEFVLDCPLASKQSVFRDTWQHSVEVEELFNVAIPDEVADGFRTVQEIADFVTKRRVEIAGEGAQLEVKEGIK